MPLRIIKDFKVSFEEKSKLTKNKIIDELIEALRRATPIDTGVARAGWIGNENSIENKVDYIDALNRGTSKQAPSYFVEKTLLSKPEVIPNGTIVRNSNTR